MSADEIARARLADVEARIAALSALRSELKRMIAGGPHGKVADCRVIEVLGSREMPTSRRLSPEEPHMEERKN